MASRTVKWTTLLILLCVTFFLGSFNATMRILVDQRKEIAKSFPKSKHQTTNNAAITDDSLITVPPDPETASAIRHISQQQAKYAELKNPTRDKYRSFIRQLDEFPSVSEKQLQQEHDEVKSYKRQDNYHSTPHVNSTQTLADAHFAKALRMVSSPFDKLDGGGNALPPKVYTGGYKQEHRGEKFVKMNWLKKRRKRRFVKRSTASMDGDANAGDGENGDEVTSSSSSWRNNNELPDWYLSAMDIILDKYYDVMSYLYDLLGVEMDQEETEKNLEDNKVTASTKDYYTSSRNEEDVFSWSDTRVGSQLIGIYGKIVGLWTQHPKSEYEMGTSSSSDDETSKEILSSDDHIALEGLYHLEKAAELGHAEAQRMVANSLASGILPLSDHSLIQRYAKWQHTQTNETANLTAILANSSLLVPDDFSAGGEQLSRALVLWHLSAMGGNVESAMALGYRHLYSATGGTTRLGEALEEHIVPNYSPVNGGSTDIHGTTSHSHYGVLGTCPTALAYYEAAANGIMDELESGPTKGKVAPPLDEHRLAQIHMKGGASVALEAHNKPDEIEEALQYYRMLASRNRSPEPDLTAAFTIANFYHLGLRGVKQDLRLALKYYEICGDYNHWEGGGLAGLFHVWGVGMRPEERDLGKAYSYFLQGTPGGVDGCNSRIKQRRKAKDSDPDEVHNCDRHCANGMGLVSLLGIDGLVDRNVANARKWFELAKELGDADGLFNHAMLRLGWMVTEVHGDHFYAGLSDPTSATMPSFDHGNPANTPSNLNYLVYRRHKSKESDITGPSASDFAVAVQDLSRASSKGHIQARHRLAMLYATGAEVQKKYGKTTTAVKQSCIQALQYYKSVTESGHTVSQRNRAAWKQYNAGDYESALRNYLATAESGNVVGQMNAAFLLERGYCLGMTIDACTRASIRLWRAAARQGSLEACLRVGDFYYYGRMKKHPAPLTGSAEKDLFHGPNTIHAKSLEGKALYFAPGPYKWARYILYPEEAVGIALTWLARNMKEIPAYILNKFSDIPTSEHLDVAAEELADDTQKDEESDNQEVHEHMAIAAQYYRKAAEDHKSARANFNLGFMYEWGLGLNQDFPLAKRHYDLAGEQTNAAASIALFAMGIHEKTLKSWMYFRTTYLD